MRAENLTRSDAGTADEAQPVAFPEEDVVAALWSEAWPHLHARPPSPRPTLVIFAGEPLSGKSTLARALAEASQTATLHVENDAVRVHVARALGRDAPAYDAPENHHTHRVAWRLAEAALLAGANAVHDGTNVREKTRKGAYAAADAARAPALVVVVLTSPAVVAARAAAVGPERRAAHEKLGGRRPDPGVVTRPSMTIDGALPVRESLARLALEPGLRPLVGEDRRARPARALASKPLSDRRRSPRSMPEDREPAAEEAPALAVPKAEGEAVRRALLDAGLLRFDLKVQRDAERLYIPLARDVGEFMGHPTVARVFEPLPRAPLAWQEVAAREVPAHLVPLLPSSFDQVGHVVILKLPEPLAPHKGVVGRAILAAVKSARTVALDHGVEGELRVRDLEVVAGDASTETEHAEFGVRLRVDPARAYFSPRLATERKRVADLVAAGERVVDLFGGVAPFALVIARHARPARVDSVDLNPAAVALARENVRLNRAGDVVFPEHADARAWAAAHRGVADRVITNIPHSAHEFLESALAVLKAAGGTWHYHCITSEAALPAHVAALAARAAAAGRSLEATATREVRTYSPSERHYAVDLRAGPLTP